MGLGSLARGELSGERMTVAYKNRDQEEEHSCFSDSTWPDLLGNAKGIKNVWTGSYEGTESARVSRTCSRRSTRRRPEVTKALDEAVAKMKTLSDNNATAPFDVVINEADGSANRVLMLQAMKALKRMADGLEKGAEPWAHHRLRAPLGRALSGARRPSGCASPATPVAGLVLTASACGDGGCRAQPPGPRTLRLLTPDPERSTPGPSRRPTPAPSPGWRIPTRPSRAAPPPCSTPAAAPSPSRSPT